MCFSGVQPTDENDSLGAVRLDAQSLALLPQRQTAILDVFSICRISQSAAGCRTQEQDVVVRHCREVIDLTLLTAAAANAIDSCLLIANTMNWRHANWASSNIAFVEEIR